MERETLEIKRIYQKREFLDGQQKNKEVKHLRKVLFSFSKKFIKKRLLFIGCGDGTECLDYSSSSHQIFGIDISETLIKKAREKVPQGRFMVGDFENIQIRNSFDSIMSVLSLHYSGDLYKSLVKVNSLLRLGGYFVIATTHPVHKMLRYNEGDYFKRGKFWYTWKDLLRFNYLYLIEDYINNFYKTGFEIVRMVEVQTPFEQREVENRDDNHPIFTIYIVRKIKKLSP